MTTRFGYGTHLSQASLKLFTSISSVVLSCDTLSPFVITRHTSGHSGLRHAGKILWRKSRRPLDWPRPHPARTFWSVPLPLIISVSIQNYPYPWAVAGQNSYIFSWFDNLIGGYLQRELDPAVLIPGYRRVGFVYKIAIVIFTHRSWLACWSVHVYVLAKSL